MAATTDTAVNVHNPATTVVAVPAVPPNAYVAEVGLPLDNAYGISEEPKVSVVWASWSIGGLVVVLGFIEVIVAAMVFHEWGNIGAFWAGVLSLFAGVAALTLRRGRPRGGRFTGMVITLSVLAFLSILIALFYMEGLVYQVVTKVERCVDREQFFPTTSTQDLSSCSYKCICEEADSDTWCVEFKGNCQDVLDTEDVLLGSVVVLSLLCFTTFALSIVGCSACCCSRKR